MTSQLEIIPIHDYSSDESEIGDENPRISRRDYVRMDNLDEVSLWFQHAYPVVFEIKNNVMSNLKSNQFLAKIRRLQCSLEVFFGFLQHHQSTRLS